MGGVALTEDLRDPVDVGQRSPLLVGLTWLGGALTIFLVIHIAAVAHYRALEWHYFDKTAGRSYASMAVGSPVPDLASSLATFLAVGLAGVVLAARGRLRAFWLPAAAWFICSATQPFARVHVPLPQPLGAGFSPFGPATSHGSWAWVLLPSAGAVLDCSLVLVPAVMTVGIMRRGGGSETARSRAGSPFAVGVGAALIVLVLWLVISDQMSVVPSSSPLWAVPGLVPIAIFGALLGWRRSWQWALFVIPLLLAGKTALSYQWPWASNDLTVFVKTSTILVAAALLGSAWEPLSERLDELSERPLLCLILLNALNVADVLLTRFALGSEQAVEANPFARWLGWPLKLVVVGLFGWVLYRVRPRMLIWTVVAYAGVIAWHLSGWYLSSHV